MSDSENSDCSPLEALLKKQRKEKKELQIKVQTLKKSAAKGDKKRKKEVTEEIANLENEIKIRHEKEITELNDSKNDESKTNEEDQLEEINENVEKLKIGKAQRRREKKALEEKERNERIRLQEKENVHGARNKETETIKKILKDRDLMIKEIPSDGNCLYCAVLHQVPLCSITELRQRTANFMMNEPDEFLPYLTSKTTQGIMSFEEFTEYCNQLATTTTWGGQIEVKALTHVLQCPIEIIQASGPPILLGEEFNQSSKTITICYHRHMYKLGAHYNSVQKLVQESEDDQGQFQEPK